MTSLPLAVRRPGVVLLVWLFVLVAMGCALALYPRLKINPTVKTMLQEDDPDVPFDNTVKHTLADDEMIVIAIASPTTIFDIPTIAYIDHLSQAIEKLPAVRKVYSLTRADNIRNSDGAVVANDLITELPTTAADIARIRREASENPMYVNMLYAPDQKVASVNIELKAGHTTEDDAQTTERIYEIIDAAKSVQPAGVTTHFSGFPVASHLGATYMIGDMGKFSGASVLILTIIMFLVLRSWHGVTFAAFVSFCSTNVTYGTLTLCGLEVTTPLSSMTAFMTAISMEYTVYVAYAYMHNVQTGTPGRTKPVAVAESLREVRFTVIMSAACTSAAFASIATSDLHDLRVMGVFLAVGTLTCCFASLTIIPAWITRFGFPVPPAGKIQHRWLQNFVDRIGNVTTRRPVAVLAVLGVICVLGGLLLTQMRTDIDAFQYFRKDSTIRKDHEFITERMSGDALLPLIIAAPEIDAFKDPDRLRKLDDVGRYAASLPHVTKVMTHADHVKLINRALRGGDPKDHALPTTRSGVEQLLLLHNEPDDFHAWIDPDYRTANVMLRMDTLSSTVLFETEGKVEEYARQQFPGYDVRVVGTTLLLGRSIDLLSTSLLKGLLVAAVLIWIIMMIGFRSVRIGSLALIPTLPPALMTYATLPLIGHALDPPTSITGTIALGIAIDDTTWFLSTWIVLRARAGVDGKLAVRQTMTAIGRPMVLSSVVLGSGFLVMLFSSYLTLFWLGIMMAIVAFWSIFFDMLCTPALIGLIDPKLPRRRFGHEDAVLRSVEPASSPPP